MTKYFKYTFDSLEYSGFETSGHLEGNFANESDAEDWLIDNFGEEFEDYVRGWEEEGEDSAADYTISATEITKEKYEKDYDYFNFERGDRKGYFQI